MMTMWKDDLQDSSLCKVGKGILVCTGLVGIIMIFFKGDGMVMSRTILWANVIVAETSIAQAWFTTTCCKLCVERHGHSIDCKV